MKEFDSMLRDTLQDEHWAMAVEPGMLDSVVAGARRVRRRRRVTAAVAAVATGIALVAGLGAVRAEDARPPVVTPPSGFDLPGDEPVVDMLATPDSLYVLTDRVHRLDRKTGAVRATSRRLPTSDGELLAAGPTIWVRKGAGDLDGGGRAQLFGFDAAGLGQTAHVAGAKVLDPQDGVEQEWLGTPTSLWSVAASRDGRTKLIRRAPDSGKAVREVSCDCTVPLVAIDEQADVAWFESEDGTERSRLVAIRLSDGRTRGGFTIAEPDVYTVPGAAGSLWVVPLGDGAAGPAVLLGPDARRIQGRTFGFVPRRAEDGSQDEEPARLLGARRVLIAAPARNGLLCVDRSSGALLKTYPLPEGGRLAEGSEFRATGDDHEFYVLDQDRVKVHRGPDGCLS
ncbi:hypothetical protein [Spirillospora albida]|uniref:hypothetical protein n=1 Tax=Spirillospora albida TaxID=58123 RepID=UPI0004BF2418|nr:hypothetical protein [Spirillospora albida]